MDTNDKIVGTVLGLNEKEYRSLVKDGMSKNKAALIAAESALIFHADSEKHEIVDLTNFTTDEKREFVKQYFNNTEIENCSYFDGDPRLIDSQNRVDNHLEYLPIEVREEITNRVKKEEKAKTITEDDAKDGLDQIQKLTDKKIKQIDELKAVKEKDVLEV